MCNTLPGKILFTRLRGEDCAVYLQGNRLLAAQVFSSKHQNRMGAIYIGKVKNTVKNINACFIEIAAEESCFLSLKDADTPVLLNRVYDGRILEGDELLVQISREAQKNKLASVTANISLADNCAAVSIGSSKVCYSGKLSRTKKDEIREWLTQAGMVQNNLFLQSGIPVPVGLMIRTEAMECSKEHLFQSITELMLSLRKLIDTAYHRTCFSCIRQAREEFEMVLEQLAYPYEYQEMVTDDPVLYEKLTVYCSESCPDKIVRLYQDNRLPLSLLYSLEHKLKEALCTRVWLKSGAYLIIEPTEALTVIDVNTGKYETGKSAAETYEKINREAAEEIARQLRLRNLSGMILVDFINMDTEKKGRSLMELLRKLVKQDRVKTTVVDITALGLVEITRKKTNKPLAEQLKETGKKIN